MRNSKLQLWIEFILMLVVSGVIYLPFISQFGYYNDDWYSMYAARVGGVQTFHEMYSIDRPGRAYVMIPLYELFHGNPLYYNISAYVFRLLGAVALLWLLRLIWNKQKRETFLIALLFLVYPGFLSMPNAIDFQSHLIGILLAFISIGVNILAIQKNDLKTRIFLWVIALLTGWAYLSQMEYYLGFEAVRLLLMLVLVWRENPGWKKIALRVFLTWLPYSPIPIFYLIWRIFFFNNERATTDVSIQFGALFTAPLVTLYDWIGSFIRSFINVTMLAWSVPLSMLAFPLDISNGIRGITLAILVVLITLFVIRYLAKNFQADDQTAPHWRQEMFIIGIAWTIAGLIVVVLANRSVSFPTYSRYGMVSAAGAIMALVAGVSYISEKRIQVVIVGFLLFSAVFTHYANGLQYAQYAKNLRAFWWQVSWRVPQFAQGATLIANYPNSGILEDSFVWGPANHIYYPYQIKPNKVQAGVYAILLNHDATVRIINRDRQVFRKHIIVDTYRNYRNFVILSQPAPQSCVQVIDGLQPEYSRYETDTIMVIGPYSELEHIALDEKFKAPPQFLFGLEPAHNWCFYYEKASYERQRGNWDAVLQIGEQAISLGLAPQDAIEWMPFLQAYAHAGDIENIKKMAPAIVADPFVAQQACRNLKAMPAISKNVENAIDENYCIPN